MPRVTINTLETSSDEFIRELNAPVVIPGDTLVVSDCGGGLNKLYQVDKIGGSAPPAQLLLKIFKYEPANPDGTPADIRESIDRMVDLHRTFTTGGLGPGWPTAFLALPYQVFRLTLDGIPKLGALMLDITARGYSRFPFDPEATPAELAAYDSRPFPSKVAGCRSFLSKVQATHSVGWIHADINPPNLMMAGEDVQLIDLDSGTSSSSAQPAQVIGKNDMYTPPEVYRQPLPAGKAFDVTRMDAASDAWSAAMLVSTFLFSVAPVMFLNACTVDRLDDYAASGHSWPDFDSGAWYASTDPSALDYHRQLADLMHKHAPGLIPLYIRTFQGGSSGAGRPNAEDWLLAVDSLITPISVKNFEASEDVVLEGDHVDLEWDVEGADVVKINEYDGLPPQGQMTVAVVKTTQFVLEAANVVGEVVLHAGPVVQAAPLPVIETIEIPGPPELQVPGFTGFGVTANMPTFVPPDIPRFNAANAPKLHSHDPAAGGLWSKDTDPLPPPPPPLGGFGMPDLGAMPPLPQFSPMPPFAPTADLAGRPLRRWWPWW